jgi:hypothetical protein
VLRSPCITAPSWTGAGLMAVCSSRVLLFLFEGCGMEEGRERVAQRWGITPAIPHSAGDDCIVAGCSNSVGAGFPSCVSRSTWRGCAFDPGAHGVSEHLMSRPGEQVGRRERRVTSSEAETRSRG